MMRLVLTCAFAACLTAAVAAGEPGFAAKPSVAKAGAGVKISFAAAAPTDVEVAILDAKGAVIRHLAAGMLGDKPPAPLKPGLAQEIEWDGKDDLGRPVLNGQGEAKGPFRARVGLGLRPRLQRTIGDDPSWLGSIVGLAADPRNGELFVFHVFGALHPDDGSTACSVFSREGRYLRTVLPWPAGLPEDKLSGLKRVELDGRKIPFVYQGETRNLLPGAGNLVLNGPVVTADGRLVFVNHQENCSSKTRYNRPGIRRVTAIGAADGSMPEGGPLRTVLADDSQAAIMLAASPDGARFYAAGVAEGYGGKGSTPAVYAFALEDARAKPLIGDPGTAGAGEKLLNSPRDVAVDADGRIYVADSGNGRVSIYKPDGAYLGEIPVAGPRRVKVSRSNGAVYVVAGDDKVNRLHRFGPWPAPGEGTSVKLRDFRHPWTAAAVSLALDDSAEPHVLWFSSSGGNYAAPSFRLLRIEARGAELGVPAEADRKTGPDAEPGLGPVRLVSLDRRRNRLYVNGRSWDPATGRFGPGIPRADGAKGGMGSAGLDGNVYMMGYDRWLCRYGPDLKPMPFPDEAAGKQRKGLLEGPEGSGTLRLRTRGVTADPLGNIYALWQFSDEKAGGAGDANRLVLHGPDGSVKNDRLIDCEFRPISSPRLDARGNVYVSLGARPAGRDLPESFDGQDLGKPWFKGNTNEINWYHLLYGSIVKFGPSGGAVRKGSGGIPMTYSYGLETEVKGAEWVFYGASPVPSWRQKFPDTCICESAQFDVDEYGRSFFPDAGRFRVGVLDTGGNLIGWFGEYGNVDSAGPGSRLPQPEIPMLWPENIAAGNGFVYVGDRLNRRVLAVKLGHGAAEECAVP